jgi:hypothetical protein
MPVTPAPSITPDPSISRLCAPYMKPYGHSQVPLPPKEYAECVRYGWDLPTFHGSFSLGNFTFPGGLGGIALTIGVLLVYFKFIRPHRRASKGKA